MTVIVGSGDTLDVSGSLTLTADSTIAAGGVLDGSGIVMGSAFTLVNQGIIETSSLTFEVGSLVNQGIIHTDLGTISLLTPVSGSGAIIVDNSSVIQTQAGGYTQTFINDGTIFAPTPVIGGIATITGQYIGSGVLSFNNGPSISGFELASPFAGTVDFHHNIGEVVLDAPFQFTGTIENLTPSDSIVFQGIAPDQLASLAYIPPVPPPIMFFKSTEFFSFGTFYDSINNNTTLVLQETTFTFCFRAGTRIATPGGEVAIEELAIGDRVMSHFAGERTIVWIGQRTIDCRCHPNPITVLPVRIAAGAFGPGVPRRDLFLSPGHAVFFDGVLIPVKCLIDGETVCQVDADTVTYFHVELDEHDVMLANGLQAESYLDTGNRPAFGTGGQSRMLFPDLSTVTWEVMGCAPLFVVGEKVVRLRERAAAARSVTLAA